MDFNSICNPSAFQHAISVPPATGNMQQDMFNIRSAITLAGAGGAIAFKPSTTTTPYTVNGPILLLDRQSVYGFGAILKVGNQVSTTLATAATISIGATSATVAVASSSGFWVGAYVNLEDRSLEGSNTRSFCVSQCVITAINSNNITLSFIGGLVVNTCVKNTSETTVASSYTFAITGSGTFLSTVSLVINTPSDAIGISVFDLEINGNSANNPYGNRWQVSGGGNCYATASQYKNILFYDSPGDGMVFSGTGVLVDGYQCLRPNGQGLHLSNNSSFPAINVQGANYSVYTNILVDSPGMCSLTTPSSYVGHTSGLLTNPCYAGIANSDGQFKNIITNFILTNLEGSQGCTGIGHIDGGSNNSLSYAVGQITGMSHGAWQMRNITANGNHPYDITFRNIDVFECGPQSSTSGSFSTYSRDNNTTIGLNIGNTPLADRITVANCNFVNSPLLILGATNVTLNSVTLTCTTSTKSSSLVLEASSGQRSSVKVSNVTIVQPEGNFDGSTRSGWQFQYSVGVYVNSSTIKGKGLFVSGANRGVQTQTDAIVDIEGLECVNNYDLGYRHLSAGSTTKLQNPKVRKDSAFTASSSFIGLDFNASATTTETNIEVINPDINCVTTGANQIGIKLTQNTTKGARITGGTIVMKGSTDGKAISGGAAGSKNEIINVAIYPSLASSCAIGAGDTQTGIVTIVNV